MRSAALIVVLLFGCDQAERGVTSADASLHDASLRDAAAFDLLDGALLDAALPVDASVDAALELPLRTPAQLAVRAAADVEDNEAGLIGGARLGAWLADWAGTHPRDITGDLVILQLNALPGSAPYALGVPAEADAPSVRVYAAAELAELVGARSNGLVALGSTPEHGLRTDLFLRKYRLRPGRDLVLLAAGQLTPGALDQLARGWLALRYWGFPHAGLGVLGVPLDRVLPASQRAAAGPTPPVDGTARVSDLQVDQFALYADLGVVREGGVLVDVRSAEQYAGSVLGPSARDNSCTRGAPHCTPLFSGHIAGAVSLPWTTLVDARGELRSRAEIDDALSAAALGSQTLIVYDDDDRGAALVSFALLAVAGVPARWYGGSYLEWGALSALHPEAALRSLAADNPYRSDVFPGRSAGALQWAPLDIGVRPLVLNPNARSLDRVLREDRHYKRSPTELPPPGQGDNPCIL